MLRSVLAFSLLIALVSSIRAQASELQPMRVNVGVATRSGTSTSYPIRVVHAGAALLAVFPDRTRFAELIVNGAVVQRTGRDVDPGLGPLGHGVSDLRLAGLTPRDRVEIQMSGSGVFEIATDEHRMSRVFGSGLGSGIFYGILATLLLFQIGAIFTTKRESTFTWFIIWVVAVFVIEVGRDNLLSLPQAANNAAIVCMNFAAGIAYVGFVCTYLELRTKAPRLLALFLITNVATFGWPILVGALTHSPIGLMSIFIPNTISITLAIVIALVRRRAGFMPASFLAWGLLGMLWVFGGRVFRDLTGLQSPFLDRWSLEFGCVFDYFVFTLGVAFRARFTYRERGRIEAELHRAQVAAGRDPLTNLLNRRGLEEIIEKIERPASVLYIDLDGFKAINDEGGHDAGDDTLTVVARIIRHSVREQDAVARFGGDEFVVVLAACDDNATVENIASRISSAVGFLLPLGPESDTRIGASIGSAVLTDRVTFAEALKAADLGAYRVKAEHHARLRQSRRTRRTTQPIADVPS
jgi:diguanylate cyclase (GGDEF)-like protein